MKRKATVIEPVIEPAQPGAICFCNRCGIEVRVAESRSEDAHWFRLAKIPKGFCADCVFTQFLYQAYPINMQLDETGPELLLSPFMREAVLESGILEKSDLHIDALNWERIVANWSLPVHAPMTATNPYQMGDAARSKKSLREFEDGVVAGDEMMTAALMSAGVPEGKARAIIESDTGTMLITGSDVYRLPELRKRIELRGIIEHCRFCRGRGCLSCETEYRKAKRAAIESGFEAAKLDGTEPVIDDGDGILKCSKVM